MCACVCVGGVKGVVGGGGGGPRGKGEGLK